MGKSLLSVGNDFGGKLVGYLGLAYGFLYTLFPMVHMNLHGISFKELSRGSSGSALTEPLFYMQAFGITLIFGGYLLLQLLKNKNACAIAWFNLLCMLGFSHGLVGFLREDMLLKSGVDYKAFLFNRGLPIFLQLACLLSLDRKALTTKNMNLSKQWAGVILTAMSMMFVWAGNMLLPEKYLGLVWASIGITGTQSGAYAIMRWIFFNTGGLAMVVDAAVLLGMLLANDTKTLAAFKTPLYLVCSAMILMVSVQNNIYLVESSKSEAMLRDFVWLPYMLLHMGVQKYYADGKMGVLKMKASTPRGRSKSSKSK